MYFKDGPLPSLSKEEEDALDLVIYDVEMAAEEYIVEDLRRSIRQVWEVALRIGVKHGQCEARQTHTNTTKELERERVWGFDVGWRLATEKYALKASKISDCTPPLPSTSTAATQTGTPTLPYPLHSLTIPKTEPLLRDPCECLDQSKEDDMDVWYEAPEPEPEPDPASAPASPSPVSSPPPPSSTLSPRDFSDLSSGTPRPFASLQRRHRRTPRTPDSHPSRARKSRPQTIVLKIYNSTQSPTKYTPSYCGGPLIPPASRSHPAACPPGDKDPPPSLEWDHDPRLRDLGRALTALGWVRPG
ncbi:hypothetical protein B0H11DRAFT_2216115 [Mycena galericulata]|nr:hypothetical protein B0H11DRAFT_2216115 [Mycena galericulata]